MPRQRIQRRMRQREKGELTVIVDLRKGSIVSYLFWKNYGRRGYFAGKVVRIVASSVLIFFVHRELID